MEIPTTVLEWNDEQEWYLGIANKSCSMEFGMTILVRKYELSTSWKQQLRDVVAWR